MHSSHERPAPRGTERPSGRGQPDGRMSANVSERVLSTAHAPLASAAAVSSEPDPFPSATAENPVEVWHEDWRRRLTRNLSCRSDGRWSPLTHVDAKAE